VNIALLFLWGAKVVFPLRHTLFALVRHNLNTLTYAAPLILILHGSSQQLNGFLAGAYDWLLGDEFT
jgi:hypothetical protein